MRIKKITKSKEKVHTYDIESPKVHSYLIKCGDRNLISHNSSQIQNSTNGCEPIIALFQFKDDREGATAWIAPGIKKYGKYYKSAYDCSNEGIIKTMSAIIKWTDMGASVTHYYNYGNYDNGKLDMLDVMNDILMSYECGLPTLYYAKTKQVVNKDSTLVEVEEVVEEIEGACSINGGCSL